MKRLFHALCLAFALGFAVAAAVFFSHVVGHALAPIDHALQSVSAGDS